MPKADLHLDTARLRSGADGNASPARVAQVSVSGGGVPKLPVASARVGFLGLEGDDHDDKTGHGGPLRAVSLLALEAIRRVAADGHPIGPGTTGENVTTEGIELGALPAGARLAIGPSLVIELTGPVSPCKTIAHNFLDDRFARLSARVHPLDTRVYAQVIREGTVRPGDKIVVLEQPPG